MPLFSIDRRGRYRDDRTQELMWRLQEYITSTRLMMHNTTSIAYSNLESCPSPKKDWNNTQMGPSPIHSDAQSPTRFGPAHGWSSPCTSLSHPHLLHSTRRYRSPPRPTAVVVPTPTAPVFLFSLSRAFTRHRFAGSSSSPYLDTGNLRVNFHSFLPGDL